MPWLSIYGYLSVCSTHHVRGSNVCTRILCAWIHPQGTAFLESPVSNPSMCSGPNGCSRLTKWCALCQTLALSSSRVYNLYKQLSNIRQAASKLTFKDITTKMLIYIGGILKQLYLFLLDLSYGFLVATGRVPQQRLTEEMVAVVREIWEFSRHISCRYNPICTFLTTSKRELL